MLVKDAENQKGDDDLHSYALRRCKETGIVFVMIREKNSEIQENESWKMELFLSLKLHLSVKSEGLSSVFTTVRKY